MREKKLDVYGAFAVPKIAKLVWTAPKLFVVRIYFTDVVYC